MTSTETTQAPRIADRAMLASLSIGKCATTRRDPNLAKETADNHGADVDMTRFSRLLFCKDALAKVETAAGEARRYHLEQTLPWAQNGARILPSENFFPYSEKMKAVRQEWSDGVDEFVTNYDRHVAAARMRLGDLFNSAEYPTKAAVKGAFSFDLGFSPLPEGKDFRIELGDAVTQSIRDDIEARLSLATHEAMRDLWERVHEAVAHMVERLNAYQPAERSNKKTGTEGQKAVAPFRDSLVENLRGLVDLLPRLNMTGDAHLAAMTERLRAELCLEDADTLRKNDTVRKDVAARAEQILADVGGFLA